MFSNIRHAKWFIPILIILLVGLMVGGVFAAVAISNLWTSPTITVVTSGGGGGLPPALILSSPDFTTPRSVYVGAAFLASVNLSNPSPIGVSGVVVQFTINRAGIVVGDVVLTYQAVEGGDWLPIPLIQEGTDKLTGTFGPTGGFPVPSGYNVTTPIRAIFNTAGTYYATAQAIQ